MKLKKGLMFLFTSQRSISEISTWAINVGEADKFGGCAHPVERCAEAEKYLAKSREFCVEPQV